MDTLEYFKKVYDKVPDWVQTMHDYVPSALEYYTKLRNEIMVDGALSKKEKELILVGVNAARRYEKSMIFHTKGAVDSGATIEELVETLTPCILIRGIPAWLEGVKALDYARGYMERHSDKDKVETPVDHFESVEDAVNYFKDEAGGVELDWVKQLKEEADYALLHYGQLRSGILKDGHLSRKMKELILVGINVSERYPKGVEIHVNGAKKFGATNQELAEVALVGLLTAGIPAWFEITDFIK
ncbi:carboxymuconolactone decarboxylase family protein [Bacillaceae bacterium W0354]